ncbi:hypothetical protein [Psychromarinibacter sp. S121]|uniref:hypothetical protein n=1 Tax=Psychromarinibacter sp. S121 TaxID=3415127 RepID=UPI003C7DF105
MSAFVQHFPRSLPAAALAAGLALAAPDAARADGEFFQLDLSESAVDGVFALSRDRFSLNGNYSEYEGGHTTTLSVSYAFPVDGVGTFRFGPSVGRSVDDTDGSTTTTAGARIVFERWMPTDFGSLFLLAEYNTIDNNYFGLVQTGFGSSGFSAEFSIGGSDKYDATTLAVSKRLGDSPAYLRAGYKFVAEEAFIGFAINTF